MKVFVNTRLVSLSEDKILGEVELCLKSSDRHASNSHLKVMPSGSEGPDSNSHLKVMPSTQGGRGGGVGGTTAVGGVTIAAGGTTPAVDAGGKTTMLLILHQHLPIPVLVVV